VYAHYGIISPQSSELRRYAWQTRESLCPESCPYIHTVLCTPSIRVDIFASIKVLMSRAIHSSKRNVKDKSQPRINLLHHIFTRPRAPIPTSLRHRRWQLNLADLLRVRDGIHVEPAGHVPRDVAVERPHAGVVGFDLHDHVRRRAVGFGVV
jgi:hypothetical protein